MGNIQKSRSFTPVLEWNGSDLEDVSGKANQRLTFMKMPADKQGHTLRYIPKQEQVEEVQIINAASGDAKICVDGVHYDFTLADGKINARIDFKADMLPANDDIVKLRVADYF